MPTLHGMEYLTLLSVKLVPPVVVGALAAWISTDAHRQFWITLIGMVVLVVYESTRKFKKEPIHGPLDFIDRNWVRITLTAVIAPNAWKFLSGFISG